MENEFPFKLKVNDEQFKSILFDEIETINAKLDQLLVLNFNPDFLKDDEKALIDPLEEMTSRIEKFNADIVERKVERAKKLAKFYKLDSQQDFINIHSIKSGVDESGMIHELGISVKEAVENPALLSRKLIENFYQRFGSYFANYNPGDSSGSK